MKRITGLLYTFLLSAALFTTAALAEIKTVTLAVSGMT